MSSNRESSKANASVIFKFNSISRRILLVEDNDLNRQMLGDYLEFCGYRVCSLANGFGFFEALNNFQPHLILLDLKLPGVDGYTLLEQLQQKPRLQSIPVVVVSAFAFKADQQRAFKLGAKRYLVKPVNLSELKKVIQEELAS